MLYTFLNHDMGRKYIFLILTIFLGIISDVVGDWVSVEQCGCNEGNSCTEFNIKTQECLIAYLKHINQLSTTEKPWEKLPKRVNLLGSLGPLFLSFLKLYNIESWVFLRYIQCIKALLLSFKVLLLNNFNYSLFINVHLNINIQISKKM